MVADLAAAGSKWVLGVQLHIGCLVLCLLNSPAMVRGRGKEKTFPVRRSGGQASEIVHADFLGANS